ncbi:hypothetical protein GCM10023328_48140 [Modestobacter marinus]|uniref:HTH marR-type domain-containing protein n=1 Tax=Modestobacter marinus TaxID=477641 RepID=A0ABQ2GBD0_9ACTN|nr:MarR family transcriptional regulator [Modestobacter marinus]GGL83857.1 hypothetical protein GCM10011589_45320 [Modestobacter marinus]
MLIPSDAWAALLNAGILVRPESPTEVTLSASDDSTQTVTAAVERSVLPLSPSHVRHASPTRGRGRLLLVVPSATTAALDAAEAAGISVLADDESRRRPVVGRIVLPSNTVTIGGVQESAGADGAPVRRGRRPWGTLSVVRALLAGGAASQATLATHAQVTQGRVSQALAPLVEANLVRRTPVDGRSRWQMANWDALTDWWLDNYPGPGGLRTYWYGLADVTQQARDLVALMDRYDVPIAVSGDVAADVLAPWRRPGRAMIYADPAGHHAPENLAAAGLTPSGPEEATLELVVPADRGVWPPSGDEPGAGLPLADGLQVLWDLRRSPGSDTDQAVAALRTVLRARAAASPEER